MQTDKTSEPTAELTAESKADECTDTGSDSDESISSSRESTTSTCSPSKRESPVVASSWTHTTPTSACSNDDVIEVSLDRQQAETRVNYEHIQHRRFASRLTTSLEAALGTIIEDGLEQSPARQLRRAQRYAPDNHRSRAADAPVRAASPQVRAASPQLHRPQRYPLGSRVHGSRAAMELMIARLCVSETASIPRVTERGTACAAMRFQELLRNEAARHNAEAEDEATAALHSASGSPQCRRSSPQCRRSSGH